MSVTKAVWAGASALALGAAALLAPSALATGNGAPSGPHYNLNIIGVDNPKNASMDGSNRHTIFVPTTGRCRINLDLGDYNVADGNCFDGDGAQFYLPDPEGTRDADGDAATTAYSVWARALGKPGGSSTTTTCFDEAGETYCSMESMYLLRTKGKSTFGDVSRELLTVVGDFDGDGDLDREFLFDRELADYFWDYANNGLKLAQLRFYPIPSNVGGF